MQSLEFVYGPNHIMAIFWPNEYLFGVSTEKYKNMQQSGEGIKKIKQLHKQLWPKQTTANFPD